MHNAPGSKILIIEDQMIIAADICVQLSKLGYIILGINSCMANAFQTIKKTRPDIVLMNIGVKEKMDRISGAGVLMHSHHIPVIVLSYYIDPTTFQQLMELRPYALISTPFNSAGLQRGIASARQRMAKEAAVRPPKPTIRTMTTTARTVGPIRARTPFNFVPIRITITKLKKIMATMANQSAHTCPQLLESSGVNAIQKGRKTAFSIFKNLLTFALFAFLFAGIPATLTAQEYPVRQQDNIAQFKPVKQSSTEHVGGAHRAVDGNTDGNWYKASVSNTAEEDSPWLEIDLLDEYDIMAITLHNRTDCCMERLANFTISVSDKPMEGGRNGDLFASEPGQAGQSKTYTGQKRGRYVKVQLKGRNVLNLAEVVVNGKLVKSLPRLDGNVALGKPARQSSVFEGYAVANLANDGNTNGHFGYGSVTATNIDLGAWWEVDLGEVYEVSEVVIYNRTDCCPDRLNDFVIKYSEKPMRNQGDGDIFYQVKNYPAIYGKYQTNNERGKVNARYIRVALTGTNILSMAEVQVIGNLPGKVVSINNSDEYYWTYTKRTNPGTTVLESEFRNSVEKAAGYQLEESFSRENSVNIQIQQEIGIEIDIFSSKTTFTAGASLTLGSNRTNTSNLSKTIRKEDSDNVQIPASSTVYFFTKWKEKKGRVVVAYDGINWPYTATTDISTAGDGAVFAYKINDDIAPELRQYKAGEPIPEEVFQKIRNHNVAYENQKNGAGGTAVGTSNTPPNTPPTGTTTTTPPTGTTPSATVGDGCYRIQNNWYQNTYIHNENGKIEVGSIQPGWWSAQWKIIPANNGLVRIQNLWHTDQYLHIQNDQLEVGPIDNNWASALWKLEPAHSGWVRIQNSLRNDQYINNQNGKIASGPIDPNWASALWKLVLVAD
jgi:CheY-like chemotaxis protein